MGSVRHRLRGRRDHIPSRQQPGPGLLWVSSDRIAHSKLQAVLHRDPSSQYAGVSWEPHSRRVVLRCDPSSPACIREVFGGAKDSRAVRHIPGGSIPEKASARARCGSSLASSAGSSSCRADTQVRSRCCRADTGQVHPHPHPREQEAEAGDRCHDG